MTTTISSLRRRCAVLVAVIAITLGVGLGAVESVEARTSRPIVTAEDCATSAERFNWLYAWLVEYNIDPGSDHPLAVEFRRESRWFLINCTNGPLQRTVPGI